MNDLKVIVGEYSASPVELAAREARSAALEEAAQKLESLTQTKIPEVFRNCGFNFGYGSVEHPDGWRDFSNDERKLLAKAAELIRGLDKVR